VNIILAATAIQILFCVFILAWVRASFKRHLSDDKVLERVRRELNSLMIEMESSADRNVSILEDRIGQLKIVVAEADKKLALLAQESGKRVMESAVYSQLGQNRPARYQSEPEIMPGMQASAPSMPSMAAPDPAPVRPKEQIPFVRLANKPLDLELPFVDKVLDFYHRGFSTDIIAAKTGATMAEVDLVISMEQNKRLGRSAE